MFDILIINQMKSAVSEWTTVSHDTPGFNSGNIAIQPVFGLNHTWQ